MNHPTRVAPSAQQPQPTEQWKEIPGSKGRYEVSDHGRVRAWCYRRGGKRQTMPKYLYTWLNNVGYVSCKLQMADKSTSHLVHRLVMLAFVGVSELEVNHKDGDRANNHISNLEYMTHRENIRHSVNVLGRTSVRNAMPETERDREIRALVASGISQHEVARRYEISQPYVSYIVRDLVRPAAA